MRDLTTIVINVTPSPTVSSSVGIPPAQLATPISEPICRVQENLGSIPQNLSTTDGQVSPNSLLYRIRQMVCNSTCSNPQGIPSNDVAISQSNTDYCEISVGVTNTLEAWVYTKFPPTGVEQQECWNSTQNIIERCVQNQANTGWWNGDHWYQFYQLGFRPLNDPGSIHVSSSSSSITAFLTTTTASEVSSPSSTSSQTQTVASLLYPVTTSSDESSTGTPTATTSATIGSNPTPESKIKSGAGSLSDDLTLTIAVGGVLNLISYILIYIL